MNVSAILIFVTFHQTMTTKIIFKYKVANEIWISINERKKQNISILYIHTYFVSLLSIDVLWIPSQTTTFLSNVNFTNNLQSDFLYKKCFCNCSLLTVCIFCQKNIGTKAACKMLMKLAIGVNFINILHSSFLYKSALRSFSLVTFWLCNFLAQGY